ncbi:hypothetical protein CTheo_8200 [Ceratobasidium theobromae]|uniref:Uncharacterized protein n=1 Tax=Ceratobasidium theobromae TaxID=1582974 RepID=A0A5N5QAC3_9AGAM|nr:hypothetical protein CTheo_8200 [Ceratobasidium theobromae]
MIFKLPIGAAAVAAATVPARLAAVTPPATLAPTLAAVAAAITAKGLTFARVNAITGPVTSKEFGAIFWIRLGKGRSHRKEDEEEKKYIREESSSAHDGFIEYSSA